MGNRTLTFYGLLCAVFFGATLSVVLTLIINMYGMEGNSKAEAGIFAALIIAPVCEELIFRKLLFWHIFMRHLNLPFVGSALAASAMFAVCHSPAPSIAAAFVFSAACCWFYHLTGTVLFPLIMHISFNGASLLMAGATGNTAAYMEGVMLVYMLLLIIFAILACRRITDDRKTVLISKLTKERNSKRISFGVLLDPFRRELKDWQRIRTQITEIKKSRR